MRLPECDCETLGEAKRPSRAALASKLPSTRGEARRLLVELRSETPRIEVREGVETLISLGRELSLRFDDTESPRALPDTAAPSGRSRVGVELRAGRMLAAMLPMMRLPARDVLRPNSVSEEELLDSAVCVYMLLALLRVDASQRGLCASTELLDEAALEKLSPLLEPPELAEGRRSAWNGCVHEGRCEALVRSSALMGRELPPAAPA